MASEERQNSAGWRIARNMLAIVASDAAGEALTGFAIALAAHYLGPRDFGELSEAQAFLDPFEAVAAFGLAPVTITLAARRRGCDGTLRGTVTGLRFVLALIAGVVCLAGAVLTGRSGLLPVLAILAVGLVVSAHWNVLMLPFQVDQAMHRLLAMPFLASLVRVGTAFLAVRLLCTQIGFQLSGLAAGIATAILFGWAARRYYPDKLRFDAGLGKKIARVAWPAAIESFLVMAYVRGNYFFLHDADPLVKGNYAAADRLVLRPLLGVAAALFVSSLPTVAILAEEKDYEKLRSTFLRSATRITIGLGVIIAIAWPASAWLLQTLAPQYAGAVWPFRILLVGSFFMFIGQLSRSYVAALGRYRAMMAFAAANLAVFVVMASIFVGKYGGSGAALATTITELVSAVSLVSLVLSLLRRARRDEQKSAAAAATASTPGEGVRPIAPPSSIPAPSAP